MARPVESTTQGAPLNINSDDLLAQIQHDFPVQYETSMLRYLTELQDQRIQAQDAEIEDLKAQLGALGQPGGYQPSIVRPYAAGSASVPDPGDGAHHGI